MKINKIENQPNVSFGVGVRKNTLVIENLVSKRVTDVVELQNGKTITYSTNYLKNRPTDKLVRVYNQVNECIASKFRTYKDGKVDYEIKSY